MRNRSSTYGNGARWPSTGCRAPFFLFGCLLIKRNLYPVSFFQLQPFIVAQLFYQRETGGVGAVNDLAYLCNAV